MATPVGTDPNAMRVQAQLAQSYIDANDWQAAIGSLAALCRVNPGDAKAWIQLSYCHSMAGEYVSARDASIQASRCRPRDLATTIDIVSRLRTFNLIERLVNFLNSLGPVQTLPIPLLLSAANALSSVNEQSRALALLDEARRADRTTRRHGWLGEGSSCSSAASTKPILRSFVARHPLLSWPRGGGCFPNCGGRTNGANHAGPIEQQLARNSYQAHDRAMLEFALHAELEQTGDYDGAWGALERACKAKRASLAFDASESTHLVDALFGCRWKNRLPWTKLTRRRSSSSACIAPARPCWNSCSTPVRRSLGLGELYDFTSAMRHATDHHCKGVIDRTIVARAPRAGSRCAGAAYLRGIGWRLGPEQSHFTDKLPSNFLNLGFICRALPQARILHMVRDPVETCFSNLRELFSDANPYSYDQRGAGRTTTFSTGG